MSWTLASRSRAAYHHARSFFSDEIWERRLDELSPRRAAVYSAARIAQRAFRGLVLDDAIHVRAAALTYFTVLSLVPLLAFVFAVLKGFGAYDLLIDQTIRPYIMNLLSGNEALAQAFERILGFVEGTGVASLGLIGLLTLLYAATRLLRNVESALNALWDVRISRAALDQLRDYIAIIAVTPLCLMAAAALATAGQALQMLRAAGEIVGLGTFVDQAVALLGPLLALFLGLLLLYRVMPHTHVQLRSAALGAALGAVAWYLVLIAHVRFQVGVARFNALYSSFAALPIFLAWLHLSWLVVLLGAQIAATHQSGRSLAQRARLATADQALRESICIAVTLRISDAFLRGQAPLRAQEHSTELDIHMPLLADLMQRLVDAKLLLAVEDPSTPAYVLARPPEQIRVKDVLDALRQPPHDAMSFVQHARVGQVAVRIWRQLDDELERSPANRTLRELCAERNMEAHAT